MSPAFDYPDLPIDRLQPSPMNPRKFFNEGAIDQLCTSILSVGILQSLVVRPVGDHYEIVSGERRYRAALKAQLATVPARVRPLTDDQALEIMVIENLQREDVNPLEEGDGFARLLQAGYGLEKLVARIGMSRKYIYDRIKLGALIPEAQAFLTDGRITAGHAILLARLTPADQVRAIDLAEGGLFVDVAGEQYEVTSDDPSAHVVAVSVREFDAWIAANIRLDLAKPVASEDFPAAARAQEMAARLVSITLQPFLDPRQDEGAFAAGDRILTSEEWKRADGTTEHPLHGRSITHDECPLSLLGVVVIGREKGTTFPVCVDRACDVHWKTERAEAARRLAPAADDDPEWDDTHADVNAEQNSEAQRKVRQQQWQATQDRERTDRDAYRLATPTILAAFVACVKKLKPGVLVEAVLTGAALHPKALAAFPHPKTAEDLLRVLAVAMVADGLFNEYSAPVQVPLWAKRFGLDLKPLLKPAKTALHTSAQKKASRKIAPQPKPKPKKKTAGKGRR